MEQNKQTDLNSICKDLELIIEGLATGKESYREEETRYSLEKAVDYLREYLQELKDLSRQILEYGNTPKLLKKVHDKYTELWLFQLYFPVDSLPGVIGPLWRYPEGVE